MLKQPLQNPKSARTSLAQKVILLPLIPTQIYARFFAGIYLNFYREHGRWTPKLLKSVFIPTQYPHSPRSTWLPTYLHQWLVCSLPVVIRGPLETGNRPLKQLHRWLLCRKHRAVNQGKTWIENKLAAAKSILPCVNTGEVFG